MLITYKFYIKSKGDVKIMSEIIEVVIEFFLEIIVEGTIELCGSKKVSKWIRYPLITLFSLICLAFIGWLLWISYCVMITSIVGGFIILGIAVLLMACFAYQVIRIYKKNYKNSSDTE